MNKTCLRSTLAACLIILLTLGALSVVAEDRAGAEYQVFSDSDGAPYLLSFAQPLRADASKAWDAGRAALEIVSRYGGALGAAPESVLLGSAKQSSDINGFTKVEFEQISAAGIPVLNVGLSVLFDKELRALSLSGRVKPINKSPLPAKMSRKDARLEASRRFETSFGRAASAITGTESLYYDADLAEGAANVWLVSAAREGGFDSLSYKFNADTGELMSEQSNLRKLNRRVKDCSISGNLTCLLDVYNASYNYTFGRSEAAPERHENPTPAYFGSLEVDQNHTLMEQVHNYWFSHFGLNGANNLGGTGNIGGINQTRTNTYVLLDHLWSPCPGDAGYLGGNSCFQFCQGTGNSPDMVGHEYFHAVAWFEFSPNGTEYYGEIGALEEGTADFYGEALEDEVNGAEQRNDWHFYPQSAGGGRSLKDPPSFGYLHADRFGSVNTYCGTDDHGGAHHNSTIFSKSLYLMSEGSGDLSIHPDGRFNGCAISGIGFDAVQNITYHAWHNYFGRNTSFNEAAAFMQQSCSDLYGATNPQYCESVAAALQAVEMDQLGYCLDPEGLYYHLPACAQPPVVPGLIDSARPTQGLASLFSPQEWVYALGAGWQNITSVNLYLSLHETDRVDGTAISSLISPVSAELDESGSFVMPLWNAAEPGLFDLIVDGNSDGIYNSATDRLSTFEVRALTDGDGLCYAGERYETSENCRSAPTDCACTPQNGSPRYCTSFANQGRHRCLTLAQIQWLKAHPIEEALEVIQH